MDKVNFRRGMDLIFGALVPSGMLGFLSLRRIQAIREFSELSVMRGVVLIEGVLALATILAIWRFMVLDPRASGNQARLFRLRAGIMGILMGLLGTAGATLVLLARHYYPSTWQIVIDAACSRWVPAVLLPPLLLRWDDFDRQAACSLPPKEYARMKKIILLAGGFAVLGFLVSLIPSR